MRLVVNTNVFISAALKESPWPGSIVRWLEQYGGLLRTPVTEQGVFNVLRRPRIAQVLVPPYRMRPHRIFEAAELVTISEPMTGRRDPKDDKFLELAVNGRAGVIVSGDANLLVVDTFRGIPIVTHAAFRLWQAP